MDNGRTIEGGRESLRGYLLDKYDGSPAFREYVRSNALKRGVSETDAYETLSQRPTAYRRELERFVDLEVMSDLEGNGIIDIDLVPVTEREFSVRSGTDGWSVTGHDAREYNERYAEMDVGDRYETSAYQLVRTRNVKPRKR